MVDYIHHQHSLLIVCYGRGDKTLDLHWYDRVALVLLTFLWSFTLNCAIALEVGRSVGRHCRGMTSQRT